MTSLVRKLGVCAFALGTFQVAPAQSTQTAEVRLRLSVPGQPRGAATPAVAWLSPADGTPPTPFPPSSRFTLTQKNRMFTPHLLVIPVGSAVDFPNADPFFHNVFSLFNGKRFDLGLYEAGSSKRVVFSREGVSYIFCNIHPEMSAVVLSLSTPLYAVADANESFVLHAVRPGEYRLNVWVEGVPQTILATVARKVHIQAGAVQLGDIAIPIAPQTTHRNKFGGVYESPITPSY